MFRICGQERHSHSVTEGGQLLPAEVLLFKDSFHRGGLGSCPSSQGVSDVTVLLAYRPQDTLSPEGSQTPQVGQLGTQKRCWSVG